MAEHGGGEDGQKDLTSGAPRISATAPLPVSFRVHRNGVHCEGEVHEGNFEINKQGRPKAIRYMKSVVGAPPASCIETRIEKRDPFLRPGFAQDPMT